MKLDDTDILVSAKYWADDSDRVLSDISGRLSRRDLYAIELQNGPFSGEKIQNLEKKAQSLLKISPELIDYYVFTGTISNLAYVPGIPEVKILLKSGKIVNISEVSDILDHRIVSEKTTKFFICYPKECR